MSIVPPPPPQEIFSINPQAADDYLIKNGWPTGLRKAFIENIIVSPIRYVIIDDSGSMAEEVRYSCIK